MSGFDAINRIKQATGITVANCSTCDQLGSEGDGPEYNGTWPVCDKHERMGYLTSFPFKKEMKCWEPSLWASRQVEEGFGKGTHEEVCRAADAIHEAVRLAEGVVGSKPSEGGSTTEPLSHGENIA